MNPNLRDECLCGECGPCRRSLRELAHVPPTPVVVSEKVREILAEPVGTPYRPPSHRGRGGVIPRAVVDRRPDGHIKRVRPSKRPENRRKIPTPTPCENCGGMRGLKPAGHANKGWALAGKDGLCEVCADIQWCQEVLAMTPPSPQTAIFKHKLQRARRFQHRILKDGRAYHPDAPQHGTPTAYTNYGCKCPECLAWKSEYGKVNPHVRKAS